MRFALHPRTRSAIAADAYAAETGSVTTADGDRFKAPDAVCKFCKDPIYLVAKTSLRAAHFRHYEYSTCPTKVPAGEPYLDLVPRHADIKAGERLRASFSRNWKSHFKALADMIPCLSPEEFIRLMELANKHRIWDRPGLREIYLPSLFVLLADFPPWTSTRINGHHSRKLWFRFWFDSNIRKVEDLWIEQRPKLVLYRASFDPPSRRNGRPEFDDLRAQKEMPVDLDFLAVSEVRLHGFIMNPIEEWFRGKPAFRE